MAEVIGWVFAGENYTENTALSSASHESATGQSRGIVSLDKQLTVQLVAKIPRGEKPTYEKEWDPGSGHEVEGPYYLPKPDASGVLELAMRGTATKYRISQLHGRNWATDVVPEAEDPSSWVGLAVPWTLLGGRAFCEGYEHELMGVTVWRAIYVCEAMDVKRLQWYGKMNPTKFRNGTHRNSYSA